MAGRARWFSGDVIEGQRIRVKKMSRFFCCVRRWTPEAAALPLAPRVHVEAMIAFSFGESKRIAAGYPKGERSESKAVLRERRRRRFEP